MKTCPFCAELIQDKAIKCRYCHEWLEKPPADRVTEADLKEEQASPVLSEQELELSKKLDKLPELEIPYLYRAIHKYFPEDALPEKVERTQLLKIAIRLHTEQAKALQALLSIYQLN